MKQELQILQQIAGDALSSTDFKIKSQAEMTWRNFIFTANEQQIQYLLKQGSQTILFLIALILLKYCQQFKNKNGILTLINQQMIAWHQFNGSFIRNEIELQLRTSKCFGDYTASILKQFLIDDRTQLDVLKFLDILSQKPKYLVFILLKFIQIVSLVDNSMGFVKYKAMIQKFQQKIIPMILSKLVPFFLSINDCIQQKQLASLQQNLSFNDQFRINPKEYMIEFTQNNKFTQIIFSLLDETLDFKYNIHYTQYDDMFNYNNFFISYPEIVLKKIINQEFLVALYKIIANLMKLPNFHTYLSICLKSLKKILLAKLSYIKEIERLKILQIHFNGLNHLLELLYQKQVVQRKSGLQIIDATLKMLNIMDFDKFLSLCTKNQILKPKLYRWLQLTCQIPIMILNNDKNEITSQNELLVKSISLMYQISNLMQMGKIKDCRQIFIRTYHNYTKMFIHSIIFNKIDLQDSKQQRKSTLLLNQINNNCKLLFQEFRLLLTYNYKQSFTELLSIIRVLQSNLNVPLMQYSWGNLIIFSIYLINDNKIYQCGIFGDCLVKIVHKRNVQFKQPQELELLSIILFQILSFVQKYCQSGMKNKYLNNSIILFLQSYLGRCVDHIDFKEKSQQYKNQKYQILDFLHKTMMKNIPTLKDDEFMLNLIKTYLNFLFIQNVDNVQYILTSIYKIINEFKRQTKDMFFTTKVYAELFKCFQSLCQMHIPNHLIKCNTQIYQIITLLLLDNSLESYRRNMGTIMGIIKNSIENKLISKVLYDLIGILQSLQQRAVFNKFIRMMVKDIDLTQLTTLFARMIDSSPIYMKDVLHFSYLLIINKQNRLQQQGIMYHTYHMIKIMLPLWNYCLKIMINIKDSKFNVEELLDQFCKILGCILNGNYINIYVLESNMKIQFYTFIKSIINTFIIQLENISDSPDNSLIIMKSAKDLIFVAQKLCFNSKDSELVVSMEEFIFRLINLIIYHYQSIISQVFNHDILSQILNALVKYHEFIFKYLSRKHLSKVQQNIAAIMMMNVPLKMNVVYIIIKIGLSYGSKNIDIVTSISKLFVKLVTIYDFDINQIDELLQLKEQRDKKQIKLIMEDIKKHKNQDNWMGGRVKDWLKNDKRYYSYGNIDY